MSSGVKNFLQYFVIIGITALLIYLSLRGLKGVEGENKWDYLIDTWAAADKGWLFVMAALSVVSHLIRAERWKMLLSPIGYNPKLTHSFYSLMVGYLVNLVIPRGGEISRCYNLYKLDKIPVVDSFGTVVIERIIDLFFLAVLIGISFAFESGKLFAFIETLAIEVPMGSKLTTLVVIIVAGLILLTIGYWIIKKNKRLNDIAAKTWNSFRGGLVSIFKLKQRSLFIFYSCLIWLLYFAMSYAVLQAFPATDDLKLNAVLSLFAIGAIAMAAPLPGGTGSYHVLVPQGLFFLYGIPLSDAVAFTFIFHGWQTILFIAMGAMSLITTSFLVKNLSKKRIPN